MDGVFAATAQHQKEPGERRDTKNSFEAAGVVPHFA
jgi:hypothetical protein